MGRKLKVLYLIWIKDLINGFQKIVYGILNTCKFPKLSVYIILNSFTFLMRVVYVMVDQLQNLSLL